jgi:hypothetical protein
VRAVLKRELGRVGRRRGQGSWRACVRASPRWFTGKEELTGKPDGAATGDGRAEGTTHCADRAGPRDRERTRARAKATDADKPTPPGRGRERERAGKGTGTDRWSPSVKQRGRARPCWAELG